MAHQTELLTDLDVREILDIESGDESSDTFIPEKRATEQQEKVRRQRGSGWSSIQSIFFVVSILLSFFIGFYWPTNLSQLCYEYTSVYSPIIDDVDLSYRNIKFNNTLLYSNVYRDDPSSIVDEAWHQLGTRWNNMTVAKERALKTPIPPGSVRVQDEYGGGYMGMLEVFHQLHCLNLLRKALVYNYDHYLEQGEEEFYDGEPIIKLHVGHCLDMIRQQLMCSADVGLVPFVWVDKRQWMPHEDTKPHRLPRFDNTHRCRDFDAIREWYLKNQDYRPFNHVRWDPRPDEDILHGYH
ncbi:hypothetical protein F5Y10DRAFT_293829 [Nemania abortiva]|nr:hypothetical protein F5Y10DRAFT_293829 [Nemania abortiva]